MGEAKRRKRLDPNFGKVEKQLLRWLEGKTLPMVAFPEIYTTPDGTKARGVGFYIHDSDNEAEAIAVIKKQNPHSYRIFKQLGWQPVLIESPEDLTKLVGLADTLQKTIIKELNHG